MQLICPSRDKVNTPFRRRVSRELARGSCRRGTRWLSIKKHGTNRSPVAGNASPSVRIVTARTLIELVPTSKDIVLGAAGRSVGVT